MKDLIKTMKIYYSFIATRKLQFGIFIFLLTVATILDSIVPYFYKLFVDAIPGGLLSTLLSILFAYFAIKIVNQIIDTVAWTLGDRVLMSTAALARETVMKKIHDLDFAYHTSKSTGSLISAIKRGDGAFFSLYHNLHFQIYRLFISLVVMLIFFGFVDYRITIVIVISIFASAIAGKFIIGYNVRKRREFLKEEDKVSGVIVDNLINFETVKYFAKESVERKRLHRHFQVWQKRIWEFFLSFRVFDITLSTINIISVTGVLYVSLLLTIQGNLDVGDFVLVASFLSIIYPRLFEMIWNLRHIAKNYADIEKYFGVLDMEVQIKDPLEAVEKSHVTGEIEFNNVSFSYKDGKRDAITKLNLRIRQGQSIALVGRSGSGKTTLIKLLMRFYDVNKGKITIDGDDIKDFSKSNLRSFMGVVPQEPIMFNNTVGYNIGYGKERATKKEIIAAAKLANLHDFIETLNKGYNTNVGERGIKLSGGQKQRLAIARMILSEPDIVIFDEATSQLDSENEKLIQEAFWKSVKDKTTIIIAHRLSTAMRADKIVVVEDGKIVEEGSHKALINKKDSLYRYFWGLQMSLD